MLFRKPVSIEGFGSFIFLREEQCDWIMVCPSQQFLHWNSKQLIEFCSSRILSGQFSWELKLEFQSVAIPMTLQKSTPSWESISWALSLCLLCNLCQWKVCISISELLLSAKVSCAFHTSAAEAEFYCFSQSWCSEKIALWCHRQLIEVHYLETKKVTRGT